MSWTSRPNSAEDQRRGAVALFFDVDVNFLGWGFHCVYAVRVAWLIHGVTLSSETAYIQHLSLLN